jgi:exodeoxyribonuclease V gamma subunit
MIHVHRSERADGLVQALGTLLAEPFADPFAAEVVSVPTRGMERWLSQSLSARLGASPDRRDGICANVLFPSPRRLVAEAIAAASGVDPREDPWAPERSTWPLIEVIDQALGEPWLKTLAKHLGHRSDPPDEVAEARRLGTARHLAELFDRYSLYRPAMVRRWAAGDLTDGLGNPLPAQAVWQARLWTLLRALIASPGPAERLERACARLGSDPACSELPVRLSLFGLTRLPAGELHVIRALATERDVHLFLLHPSPALWEAIAGQIGAAQVVRRCDDPSAELAQNRLLASWGRDSREMQLVLGAPSGLVDHHHALQFDQATLLERVQADVRADRQPPGPPLPEQDDTRPMLAPDDRSIQVHACHGRARQVEVLRDAVLHVLAQDKTLEPRDVIVMCPDIESFAPLIQATFGAGEVTTEPDPGGAQTILEAPHEPVDLRVRLADRSLRQTNALLAMLSDLLELVSERVTASQVLDFADREPVRRRFHLSDDDLAKLQSWVSDSGIRWGLDAEHRAWFHLSQVPAGTWRAGLDRVLLGVTMSEDHQRLFEGVLPLDDVDGTAIDLAGRFAELIARLQEALDSLRSRQPLAAWAQALSTAAESLAATGPRDAWQRAELQRILDQIVEEAALTVFADELAFGEVRTLLAERLAGRPTRANFRTGHMTVCTLYPMRSVPHRVVCLLGLDDGAFPRKAPRDGDDLMLADPYVGERDPRSEDRQLLLDALLAATDQLIITYTGNDERTNVPRPPAVPVGELLDTVDATVRTPHDAASRQVLTRHPLQPFDPRNFERGELVPELTWSFDGATLAGARALLEPRKHPGPFLVAPLEPLDTKVIELDDLVRFVQHPVRAFLRRRLRITLRDISDEVRDELPIELDGLERWAVGQRLLEARLAGVDGRAAGLAEIARGTLPPGFLGEPVLKALYRTVDSILGAARAMGATDAKPTPVDVHVTLPGGTLLSGSVPGVRDQLLLSATYSRVSARHRLATWVKLLAVSASHPETAFSAATVGRGPDKDSVMVAAIKPLAGDAEGRRRIACEQLSALADLYGRGMREPLPLYCLTSAAYAQAAAAGEDPVAAGRQAWATRWRVPGEDQALEHQLVLAGVHKFEELLVQAPREDEQGPGWEMSEASRLGRLARRLWQGPLRYEEISTR